MAEKKLNAHEKLEKLSRAVSEGWKRSHPVPEKYRAMVKQIAQKQFAEEKKLSPEQRQARLQQGQKKLAKSRSGRESLAAPATAFESNVLASP